MFKSVFTKYLTAFTFIILVSFTILAAIICTMVYDYANDTRAEIVRHTANAAKLYFDVEYGDSEYEGFDDMLSKTRRQSTSSITMLAESSGDLIIFITDENGKILLSDKSTGADTFVSGIPADVMNEVALGNGFDRTDTLGGALTSNHLIYALPLLDRDGSMAGAVFAASSADTAAQPTEGRARYAENAESMLESC